MSEEKPLREVRSVVVPSQCLFWATVWALMVASFIAFAAYWIAFKYCWWKYDVSRVRGPASARAVQAAEQSRRVAYAVSFPVSWILAWAIIVSEIKWRKYNVFADRIESSAVSWSHETVAMADVTGVEWSEGVLQRASGVGTVTLTTEARNPAPDGMPPSRRYRMVNVRQPRELCQFLRSLLPKKDAIAGG